MTTTLPKPSLVNWTSRADDADYRVATRLAQALANTIKAPVSVIAENDRYFIRDDADLDVYGGRAQAVATYQPLTNDPPVDIPDEYPDPTPGGPEPGEWITTLLDAQTMRRCLNCGGEHRTWQCAEIARALFAPAQPEPWKDIALGRELCRMKWRDFRAFVALLLSVTPDTLIVYATSYQAFIRSYRPDSDMTLNEVLTVWAKDMARGGGRAPAALRAAA